MSNQKNDPTRAIVGETKVSETNTIVPETKMSFEPNDFAADIAKLAASKGINTDGTPVVVSPVVAPEAVIPPLTTPVQPETATVTPVNEATKPEVVVPDKFKNPDGSVNVDNLNKSTQNVDEAIATYLAKEKELKRKMNEVKAQENAYINPPAAIAAPAPANIPINPTFAAQLEADVARDGFGVVAAKLFTAAQQSAVEQIKGELDTLKGVNADNTTKQQIESIGKSDPWVYTPEGMATLTKILDEQPYLWNASDPYKAAYLQYNGLKSVALKSNSQVLTPTPQARPTAPVPSGQAVNRTSAPVIKLDTKQDIDNHLKTLTSEQKREFFRKINPELKF